MAERRALTFATLDQVMPDVDRLLEGYEALGNWSLGQACSHLTGAIVGSIDGFPVRAPWLIRHSLGPIILRRVLRAGRIREGVKLPEALLPRPGLDDRAEAEALRGALRAYAGHTGPMADHPFFGRADRDQWSRMHAIHCAHHLSFLQPRGGA